MVYHAQNMALLNVCTLQSAPPSTNRDSLSSIITALTYCACSVLHGKLVDVTLKGRRNAVDTAACVSNILAALQILT